MRSSALLWLCSVGVLVGCGTAPVVDRGDSASTDAVVMDANGSDGAVIDASSQDGSSSDVATDTEASDATSDASADSGPCGMGQSMCSGSCVDLQTSAANCGMCGRMCPAGAACAMGVCQATCGLAGLPCCAGNVCEEGTTCTAGSCVRAMPAPIYQGSSLVNSGNRSNSTSYRMFSTLGQSTQHQQSMSSTNYVLRGGLVGVVGGI